MDRLIYTAMTGAKHAFLQQAGIAQNLANASTTGYRAVENKFRAVPILGDGASTRAFVVDASVGNDYTPGPIETTGRPLDVALTGAGWLSVQGADGREAYTRAGNLQINVNGQLQTASGLNVLGDGGTIAIPPDNSVTIGADGTISTVPLYGAPNTVNVIGRLKLVNPPESNLVRGDDGLFRTKDGAPVDLDEAVKVAPASLEGSNVNPVDSMVNLISVSRQFEMQIKMLTTADTNATKASQILSMTA